MIYVHARDTNVPQELIDDYLAKYPPTFSFSKRDLDVQKMMHGQVKRQLEMIDDYESDRGFITRLLFKGDEYKALMLQCHYEQVIRCELGMADEKNEVGCPIAFMTDDSERDDEWEKLEKLAEATEMDTKNMNWGRPDHLNKCKSSIDRKQQKAMDALGMDYSDLPPEARLPRF